MINNNVSSLNSFSTKAVKDSFIKYKDLSLNRKVMTIALSIFATLVSLPLLGLGGVLAFRALSNYFFEKQQAEVVFNCSDGRILVSAEDFEKLKSNSEYIKTSTSDAWNKEGKKSFSGEEVSKSQLKQIIQLNQAGNIPTLKQAGNLIQPTRFLGLSALEEKMKTVLFESFLKCDLKQIENLTSLKTCLDGELFTQVQKDLIMLELFKEEIPLNEHFTESDFTDLLNALNPSEELQDLAAQLLSPLRYLHLFFAKMIGLEKFSQIPVFDLTPYEPNSPYGYDYIDFIKPEYLSQSIVQGIDQYGRAFMAFKYINRSETAPQTKGIKAFVIHPRFSGEENANIHWEVSSAGSARDIFSGNRYKPENIEKRMRSLINHEPLALDPGFIRSIRASELDEEITTTSDGLSVIELID